MFTDWQLSPAPQPKGEKRRDNFQNRAQPPGLDVLVRHQDGWALLTPYSPAGLKWLLDHMTAPSLDIVCLLLLDGGGREITAAMQADGLIVSQMPPTNDQPLDGQEGVRGDE